MRRHFFFFLLLSIVLADVLLWFFKFTPSQWIEYTYNGAALLLIALEFLMPRNPDWNYVSRRGILWRETLVDVFFFFWSGFFASVVTYAFSWWAADRIRSFFGLTADLPVPGVVQWLLLIPLIDLLRYWLHRWMHEIPWLWRFHALHHMPTRLGAVTSTRTHPVDDFILYVPELILLFSLGFDRFIVGSLYTVIWVISLAKHSNVDFAETGFSRHFQLPRYHLIHHAEQDETAKTYNFSEILTLWDRVFGTYKGDEVAADHRVGVSTEKPRSFFREFLGWIFLPIQRL